MPGVWFLTNSPAGPAVERVDPRRNRVTQAIRIQTPDLVGIAVGAGSIWATDPTSGVIWRIDPGRRPVERTIPVGFGVTQVAFGAGEVWAANVATGTVARINPRTNEVTRTDQLVGTPQGIAVGSGSVWVSLAGGRARTRLASPAARRSPPAAESLMC